jgi:hypothetical protein
LFRQTLQSGLLSLGASVSITIVGDIVGPVSDISDWEAARDSDEKEEE